MSSPPLWATDPEPEDPLEAIRAASDAVMASTEDGRVDAWLEEIRTRREAERSHTTTEPKHPPLHYQNKGDDTVNDKQTKPRTISDLFPSKWLRSTDLKNPVTVKIAQVELVEVYNKQSRQQEQKLALSFEYLGKPLSKRLLVNKTNGYRLAEILETEVFADWPGKTVTLAPGRSPNGKPTIVVKEAAK